MNIYTNWWNDVIQLFYIWQVMAFIISLLLIKKTKGLYTAWTSSQFFHVGRQPFEVAAIRLVDDPAQVEETNENEIRDRPWWRATSLRQSTSGWPPFRSWSGFRDPREWPTVWRECCCCWVDHFQWPSVGNTRGEDAGCRFHASESWSAGRRWNWARNTKRTGRTGRWKHLPLSPGAHSRLLQNIHIGNVIY